MLLHFNTDVRKKKKKKNWKRIGTMPDPRPFLLFHKCITSFSTAIKLFLGRVALLPPTPSRPHGKGARLESGRTHGQVWCSAADLWCVAPHARTCPCCFCPGLAWLTEDATGHRWVTEFCWGVGLDTTLMVSHLGDPPWPHSVLGQQSLPTVPS